MDGRGGRDGRVVPLRPSQSLVFMTRQALTVTAMQGGLWVVSPVIFKESEVQRDSEWTRAWRTLLQCPCIFPPVLVREERHLLTGCGQSAGSQVNPTRTRLTRIGFFSF